MSKRSPVPVFAVVVVFLLASFSVSSARGAEESIPAPPDVAAAPADAETTASGLASRLLSAGSGEDHPEGDSWVRVHYTGWTTDGEMFDSSVVRGKSLTLPLSRVIDGWTEGVQLMVEGEKRRFWIPEAMAYGGKEGQPQGTLVFDIELVELIEPPQTPEYLTAPPADAEKHKKGLASKLLHAGTGTRNPRSTSTVQVHYSGWTTDGSMFDTTVIRGTPATFALNAVIEGWTAGLKLMVEGEKRRLWIPPKMAYEGDEGKPQGMLIFDIELVTITVR